MAVRTRHQMALPYAVPSESPNDLVGEAEVLENLLNDVLGASVRVCDGHTGGMRLVDGQELRRPVHGGRGGEDERLTAALRHHLPAGRAGHSCVTGTLGQARSGQVTIPLGQLSCKKQALLSAGSDFANQSIQKVRTNFIKKCQQVPGPSTFPQGSCQVRAGHSHYPAVQVR